MGGRVEGNGVAVHLATLLLWRQHALCYNQPVQMGNVCS
jgi:hypothetical protein